MENSASYLPFAPDLPDELILLKEPEVEFITKRKRQTLRIDRVKGIGIPFVRVGKRQIRYRLSDVKAYIAGRVCQSTSQELG